MRYVLLGYGDPGAWAGMSDEERAAWEADDAAINAELDDKGWRVFGAGLGDVESATTVRVRGGECAVTDGPFAETSEVLGGFLVLDAPDLDAVLDLVRRFPASRTGTVEIRPVVA